MEFQLDTDYTISKGNLEDVKDFVKKPYTSPRLEKGKEALKEKAEKKFFSFRDLTGKNKEEKEQEFEDLTEEKVNEEIANLGEDDYRDMASFIIAAFDWVLEKVLNNFFKREQIEETKAQQEKIKRMKIIGGKIAAKYGAKFKIELFGLFLLVGFTVNRYNSAKPIEDKNKKKAPPKKKPTYEEKKSKIKVFNASEVKIEKETPEKPKKVEDVPVIRMAKPEDEAPEISEIKEEPKKETRLIDLI